MERYNSLVEFMEKYDNVSFMASNVPLILENLKKADQAGCLKQFLLNKKPYRSAFTFFVFNDNNKAARGTDQVAIVFALNLYGAENPGFAQRLNETMKELAKGSMKQAQRVIVLLRAQMELQELEISLINFVDKELVLLTNKKIKRSKGPMVALMIIFIVGGAIGCPGFTMLGLIPLTFVSMGVFVYGFVKLFYWLAIKACTDEEIEKSVREIS